MKYPMENTTDHSCLRCNGGDYFKLYWKKGQREFDVNVGYKKALRFCKKWGIIISDPDDRLISGYHSNCNMHLR